MRVLGLGGGLHDRSACLVEDGRLVAAVEHERLGRVRYGVDHRALTRCFSAGDFRPLRLDLAATGTTPEVGYVLDAGAASGTRSGVRPRRVRPDLVAHQLDLRSSLWRLADLPLRDSLLRTRGIPSHHLAHAASAFLVSPFERAVTVVIDAFGSPSPHDPLASEATSVWRGEGSRLAPVARWWSRRLPAPDAVATASPAADHGSLGVLYGDATVSCGFGVLDAGKTMALAPYGDDRYVADVRSLVGLRPDGGIAVAPTFRRWLAEREAERAGRPDADRIARTAAVAYAVQARLEEAVVHVVRWAIRATGLRRVCLAGGVALNAVANGRLLAETDVTELFVQPASNDAGIALGAAFWHHLRRTGRPRWWVMTDASTGRPYGDDEVVAALRAGGLTWRDPADVAATAAGLLAGGQVVAWFQGGSEFGPRALGRRSILADPRDAAVRDRVNALKRREWFRPFSPSVLAEHQDAWFEHGHDLPFMTVCARATQAARVPAVVHVDGTARLQTVRADRNAPYHRLIRAFHDRTGVPMVLNTSFNVQGPIVETPADAVAAFRRAEDLDALVIGPHLVERRVSGRPGTGRPAGPT